MTNLNHVDVIGNITRDLDEQSFAYTSSGTARANISIAVNRSRKQGDEWVDEVSYFDVTIWGKTAENLKPYLQKGKKIAVSGYLKQDRWKDNNGNNRSRVSIVAESVELCGGRESSESSAPNSAPSFVPAAQNTDSGNVMYGENGEFPEDIPF